MENISDSLGENTNVTDVGRSTVITGILYSFSILAILVNLPTSVIVIGVLAKKTKVRNIHILSLSITDLIFGILFMPVIDISSSVNSIISIPYTECLIRFSVSSVAYLASNAHIFGICLERVAVICFRWTKVKNNKKFVSLMTTVCSWIISLVLVITTFVLTTNDNEQNTCSLNRFLSRGPPIIAAMLGFLQVGITFSMTTLMVYLLRHERKMKISNIRTVSKNDTRQGITVGVIVLMCSLFNIPWIVVLFYSRLVSMPPEIVRKVTFLFSGFNSVINPIIYILRIKDFSKAFLQTIKAIGCCKNKIEPSAEMPTMESNY